MGFFIGSYLVNTPQDGEDNQKYEINILQEENKPLSLTSDNLKSFPKRSSNYSRTCKTQKEESKETEKTFKLGYNY